MAEVEVEDLLPDDSHSAPIGPSPTEARASFERHRCLFFSFLEVFEGHKTCQWLWSLSGTRWMKVDNSGCWDALVREFECS